MPDSGHRYFIVNKPYDMVSQFISSHPVKLLGSLDFDFPPGTHAIGRLDHNSEGLLLLTTNKKVTKFLFQGVLPHARTYLVQVKNRVSPEIIEQIKTGISIRIKGGGHYLTSRCEATIVATPDGISIREDNGSRFIDSTWIQLSLTEGKFRQIRKMFAAVHHRCRRLIRISIEELTLGDLPPGGIIEMPEKDFFNKLNIADY